MRQSPEAAPQAQCPACQKPLLTRSARLCLFCGEKLPEHLLLPLAEVQRQEQQSQEAVKRVLGAYEEREAQTVECAGHFTHAGLLLGKQFEQVDEQFGEMLFPEAGADQWALHEVRRTLKLPDDDFEARGRKRELDERLRKLASRLATAFGRLECKSATDQAGHWSVRLTDKALAVVIETQFGRNATFTGGRSQPFVSYAIRAEVRVPALNRADGAAQRFRMVCTGVGLLGMPAGFVWVAYTVARALGLEMFHWLWLSEGAIALALLGGAWVGAKVGRALAAWSEQRLLRRAEAEGALPRAEALWEALTEGIKESTQDYQVV